MKNVKRIISVFLICALTFGTTGCKMIEKTPEAVQRSVAAKVDDVKITRADVDKEIEKYINIVKEKYGENYDKNSEAKEILANARKSTLDNMILDTIIEKRAKELEVMPTEEELKESVDKQIEEYKKVFDDEEKFKEALEQNNMTIEELKKTAEINVIREKVFDKVTEDIIVSGEETKKYYDENKESFTESPNEVKLQHILVKTEEEAKKAKERIDNGEDFGNVAKEVSIDEDTKENGGVLDYLKYDDATMGGMLMTAAKVLKVDEVSGTIQDQKGWHIIKVLDKKDYPVKEYDEVKDDLEKGLRSNKQQTQWNETLKKWQEEAKIKKYEKNLE